MASIFRVHLGIHCKIFASRPLHRSTVVVTSFFFVALALTFGYAYFHTTFPPTIPNHSNASKGSCDFYDGNWVLDRTYPLYNASECPFVERGFDCLANGRRDRGYLQWRWEPRNCEVPRFDAAAVLELLRGRRVVFVGDSLSRTQWESMVCLLMTGVGDKTSVYEVNGNKITKKIEYLGVRFESFNFTVEFYRSVFLVQPASVPRRAPKRVRSTIRLDKVDRVSSRWVESDVLVFNTGHWWNRAKLFEIQGLLF